MPQVRIGNTPLEVLRDDITEQGVEAIAIAANNHLWAATDHLAGTSYIERVVFVLFDEAGYDVFREHMEKRSSRYGDCRML